MLTHHLTLRTSRSDIQLTFPLLSSLPVRQYHYFQRLHAHHFDLLLFNWEFICYQWLHADICSYSYHTLMISAPLGGLELHLILYSALRLKNVTFFHFFWHVSPLQLLSVCPYLNGVTAHFCCKHTFASSYWYSGYGEQNSVQQPRVYLIPSCMFVSY